MRYLITSLFLLGLTLNLSATPTTINYQGQLQDASGPVTDTHEMTFRLFDSESGAGQIGSELSFAAVSVENGLFQVDLDFGSEAFSDGPRYLEVEVAGAVLDPRQKIAPAPMALSVLNLPEMDDTLAELNCASGQVAKWDGSQWACATDVDTTYSAGAGLILSGTTFSLDTDHTDGLYWRRGGNAGTNPASDFLGTTDDTPFEIQVDGRQVLRLEPADTPNFIGGSIVNTVSPGVIGATIGGGGCLDLGEIPCGSERPNQVTSDFGTIGGGLANTASGLKSTIAGGISNTASDWWATIGGGGSNVASANRATIGGGVGNTVSGFLGTIGGGLHNTASTAWATIGGGATNTANAGYTTIGGGRFNIAGGNYGTVPGGRNNEALGDHSFASGRRAKAEHRGTFVWADSTNSDFVSTDDDQFLIRSGGGVGINTNDPEHALDVNGTIQGSRVEVSEEQTFFDGTPQRTAGPIAKAYINSDGSIANSVNIESVEWEAGLSRYRVTLAGESYWFDRYVTTITPSGSTPTAVSTSSQGGDLIVLFDGGTQQNFQLVVHDLPDGTVIQESLADSSELEVTALRGHGTDHQDDDFTAPSQTGAATATLAAVRTENRALREEVVGLEARIEALESLLLD
jgi:hypothetical protein